MGKQLWINDRSFPRGSDAQPRRRGVWRFCPSSWEVGAPRRERSMIGINGALRPEVRHAGGAIGAASCAPRDQRCRAGKGGAVTTREVVFVALVFALSRMLIFSAMAVSPRVITPVTPQRWSLEEPLLRPLFRWDAGWYLSIAQQGYAYNGNPAQQQNIVFLPLYPLTCRLCHLATRLSIPWCAVLLSNLAFLLALALLYRLTTKELGPRVARHTVLLLAFFPASLFFSNMYTESFYLALSLLAYASFRQQRWLLGGLWAGLASATRVPGILLLVPLLCESLPRLHDRRGWWRVLLASGLAGSGLAGFMLYEGVAFGDPLANFRVQAQAWGRTFAGPLRSLAGGLRRTVAAQWSPLPFDAWLGVLFLALVGLLPGYLPISYALYTLLGIAMPLCTKAGLFGLTRYLNVLFPGFIALGLLAQHARGLFWALLSVFAVTLILFSMRYAQAHLVE